MMYRPLARLLSCLVVAAPVLAGSFDDDFTEYANQKALLGPYGFGQFAGGGADRGSELRFAPGEGKVTLVASAQKNGQEAPAFALAKLVRADTPVMLGVDPSVRVVVDVASADMVPFGAKPIAPISLGLSGRGASPSIVGQIGLKRGGGVTLFANIQVDRNPIVQHEIEGFGKLDGRTVALVIDGDTADLTVDGESVVGGPQPIGVNLADHALGSEAMQPFIQAQKNFGKRAREASFTRFAVEDDTDQASLEAVRQEIVVTLVPAAAMLTPTPGRTHRISPAFLGYNGNLSSFDRPWDHDRLVDASRRLGVATLRYPAGSIGNVWDWDRGWVSADLDYARTIRWVSNLVRSDKRYPLDNLAKGVERVGFEPVFVLNPVHHTIEEHLGHLAHLESMGVPIRYVELGNEYYFGRGADAYIHDKYPTAEAYAKDATRWAEAIKRRFPDARVAAVGSGGGPAHTSERRRFWNDGLVPALGDAVDAITIHKYAGHGLDGLLEGNNMEQAGGTYPGRVAPPNVQRAIHAKLATPEGVAYMFTRPAAAWDHMLERTTIPDMPIWLTEYNLSDHTGAVRNTWAHGLFIAAYLDAFLRDGRVTLTHFHNLYGSNLFPAIVSDGGLQETALDVAMPSAEQFDLTAPGIVLAHLAQAMNGRDRATQLDLANAPMTRVGDRAYPAAFGWRFDGGDQPGPAYVVANLSAEPLSMSSAGFDGVNRVEQVSASPESFVAGLDSVTNSNGRLDAVLRIDPYSLAVLLP